MSPLPLDRTASMSSGDTTSVIGMAGLRSNTKSESCPGLPTLTLLTLETKAKPESLGSTDEGGVLRNGHRKEGQEGSLLFWGCLCVGPSTHRVWGQEMHSWSPSQKLACTGGPTDSESSPTPSLESITSGWQMHSLFNQGKWIPGPCCHHAELMLWK